MYIILCNTVSFSDRFKYSEYIQRVYTAQTKYKEHFDNTLGLNGESKLCPVSWCTGQCVMNERITSFNRNETYQPTDMSIQRV